MQYTLSIRSLWSTGRNLGKRINPKGNLNKVQISFWDQQSMNEGGSFIHALFHFIQALTNVPIA